MQEDINFLLARQSQEDTKQDGAAPVAASCSGSVLCKFPRCGINKV